MIAIFGIALLVVVVGGQADFPRPLDEDLLALFSGHRVAVLVRDIAAHLAGNVSANDLEKMQVKECIRSAQRAVF
jgi:hypothetical protein